MEAAIEAVGLTKRYGSTLAVDGLSFGVMPGRVTGFVGPNGAGKSTTMRLILGLDAPDAGEVLVNGKRYGTLATPLREVGALLDAMATHPGRRARNHLLWLARSNRLPRRRVDEVLELVGLFEVAGRRTGGFSLGMAQRLGIAAALLGDPPIVMFDEPINGLDPGGIRWIRSFLRSLASEGRAVLVSSHLMSELEGTGDDLVVIGRGRLLAQATVQDLLASMSDGRVDLRSPRSTEVMTLLAGRRAHRGADRRERAPALRNVATTGVARGGVRRADRGFGRVRGRLGVMRSATGSEARVGPPQALRAEWIKLRTVRSTAWALLLLIGVSVLFTAVITGGSDTQGGSPAMPGDNDIVLESLVGVWFGQIAVAVLAVLAITSEYSTRMIRTTLAAMPRRRRVLSAKAVIVGDVALVVGLATSAACFLLGQWLLRGNGFTYKNGYPEASLADGETFRAVAGSGVYLGVLALFALGAGATLRHTAGAITAVLALVLGPVIAVGLVPEGLAEPLEKFSLMGAGIAIQQTVERPDNIPIAPGPAFLVLGAYAVAALAVALWLIGRRDA